MTIIFVKLLVDFKIWTLPSNGYIWDLKSTNYGIFILCVAKMIGEEAIIPISFFYELNQFKSSNDCKFEMPKSELQFVV